MPPIPQTDFSVDPPPTTEAVIFDLDGTLADITHRLHFIQGKERDWDSFHKECVNDTPIKPIIELVETFKEDFYKIIIVSGRSDKVRKETTEWLIENRVEYDELHMRKDGDYRKDFIIKEEILDQLEAGGNKIKYVIDDRPSVVAMWRRRGLTCLQCQEWDEASKTEPGILTLMIGPSGAGKSSWLYSSDGWRMGIDSRYIVSSDNLRFEMCGDFKDQSKNDRVFRALRTLVKARVENGLHTIVDATNLHRASRMAIIKLVPTSTKIRYIVIDRPMEEKVRDGGWRLEVPGLLERHQATFDSALPHILKGDDLPNVEVIDLRRTS